LEDAEFLNRQYTVFAEVIEGMEHVDAIAKGEPPEKPDYIVTMRPADTDDE
jgi:peptidylprolyl isomerase